MCRRFHVPVPSCLLMAIPLLSIAGSAPYDPAALPNETPKIAGLPAGLRPHVRREPHGAVNWTRGRIIAEGTAKSRSRSSRDQLMAKRAAGVIASRNGVLVALGVQVDRRGRFRNVEDAELRLEAVLRGFAYKSVEWDELKNPPECTVRIEAPMWGVRGAASIVCDERRDGARRAERVNLVTPLDGEPAADEWIIIDARGIGLVPSMFPTVTAADGRVLYNFMTRRQVHGEVRPAVIYVELDPTGPPPNGSPATSQPAAPPTSGPRRDEATKDVPRQIWVRPRQAGGGLNTDIVLARNDCRALAQSPRVVRMLRYGRVIVLVDPAAPVVPTVP